jgi:hypothetical protein
MPAKMSTPPLVLLPIDTKNPRQSIVKLAQWLIAMNIREEGGANRGQWVDMFLRSVSPALIGNRNAGPPWCAAVQYWLHRQVGIIPGIDNPALSADWFRYPERVVYKRTVQPGAVVGFRVGGSDRINHIELLLEHRGDVVVTAGGNTSAAGAVGQIVRDGDGFYQKVRRMADVVSAADWITSK